MGPSYLYNGDSYHGIFILDTHTPLPRSEDYCTLFSYQTGWVKHHTHASMQLWTVNPNLYMDVVVLCSG